MASTFLTSLKPFTSHSTNFPFISNQKPLGRRSSSSSVKVKAISKIYDPTKVKPQGDRVLIKLDDLAQKTTGGVLLPKSAVKFERYLMGEILAVGDDAGDLETGKKVLFSDISAYEVEVGSEGRHCFCKAGDLLAVVE